MHVYGWEVWKVALAFVVGKSTIAIQKKFACSGAVVVGLTIRMYTNRWRVSLCVVPYGY